MKMKELATLMPAHLGLKKILWLVPEQNEKQEALIIPPYFAAIKQFRKISTVHTAWEKLSVLKRTVSAIHSSVVDYHKQQDALQDTSIDFDSFAMYASYFYNYKYFLFFNFSDLSGAEELLPLMIYIVIQSRTSHLFAECKFMEDFIPDVELVRERGYYLVTLQTVLNSITNLSVLQVSNLQFHPCILCHLEY